MSVPAWPPGAEHPEAGALVDYVERQLPPEGAERVRAHLEGCDECRELVRDLAVYPALGPPGEAYVVEDDELRAGLGDLRARLLDPAERARLERAVDDEDAAPPSASETLPLAPLTPTTTPTTTPTWLAAAAAVAIAGWGWGLYRHLETGRLEGDLRHLGTRLTAAESALRQPRANVPVAVLLAADDPLRAPETPGVSLGEAGATLALDVVDAGSAETYLAEIQDPEGGLALTVAGLEPRAGRLTFYLPPRSLSPGRYSVHLRGEGGEARGTVYELAIVE